MNAIIKFAAYFIVGLVAIVGLQGMVTNKFIIAFILSMIIAILGSRDAW